MNSFYEHHKDSIRFHYRCFDRILLNGLIQPFQQPERVIGFFDAYRHLYPVSPSTLHGIADRFQQWLKSWSQKRNIPVLEAPVKSAGRRKNSSEPTPPLRVRLQAINRQWSATAAATGGCVDMVGVEPPRRLSRSPQANVTKSPRSIAWKLVRRHH